MKLSKAEREMVYRALTGMSRHCRSQIEVHLYGPTSTALYNDAEEYWRLAMLLQGDPSITIGVKK